MPGSYASYCREWCSWSGRLIPLYNDWEKGVRYDSKTGGHVESITVSDGRVAAALGPEGTLHRGQTMELLNGYDTQPGDSA